MRTWMLLTVTLALPTAYASDGIKEGQWEYTNTMKMPGMPDMSALSKQLPPGMKLPNGISMGAGAEGGMRVTNKHCVTNESPRPPTQDETRYKCDMTQQDRKGGHMEWAMHCTGKNTDFSSKGTAMYDGNSMTSEVTSNGTIEGRPAEMNMKTTGKYLGPCPETNR